MQYLKKIEKEGRLPGTFYETLLSWYQNQTKIQHIHIHTPPHNCSPIWLMKLDLKTLNKIVKNRFQSYR